MAKDGRSGLDGGSSDALGDPDHHWGQEPRVKTQLVGFERVEVGRSMTDH
ncbi:hypothetical protein F2Q68_00003190 [Brassica cretica]|uniref:Uncharacterized protein n=1 Tax=Brassica cretica TaxID=69181 RepID=A0A8S9JGH4_BRACR|nr:hypothetical protein F2Q68_00003190 [Brassica cretica]